MSNLVTGILEVNAPSSVTNAGVVLDRFLTIRAMNGETLRAFDYGVSQLSADPWDIPISGELQEGQTYPFLLWATLVEVELTTVPVQESRLLPEDENIRWITGRIVSRSWSSRDLTMLIAVPSLDLHSWVLVDTPLGEVVMASQQVPDEIHEGDEVRFEQIRFDLLGVLA